MVNQDLYSTNAKIIGGGMGGEEPEPGSNVLNYRSCTLAPTDGAQTIYMDVAESARVVNPQQATFCFGFRLTPESGNLVSSSLYFIIQTGGFRCSFNLSIENIDLNGFLASRIRAGINQTDYATHMTISDETTGYNIMYSDINFSSKQIQPGVVYWITGNIVKNNFSLSHISINGEKLLNGTHVIESATGLGYATPSEQIIIVITPTEAIPVKFDLFNIYGAVFATPTGTDGTELMEPLVNYNDWGTPTPEDGRMYHTSENNMDLWQLNWNSLTEPLGNVGINSGIMVGNTVPFVLNEEEMFLHQTKDGEDWIVKIEDNLTTTGRWYQIHFDTDLIYWDAQHFVVVITELNGASSNNYHPFTGFSCATNETTADYNASYSHMVGTGFTGTSATAYTSNCGQSTRYYQQLASSFSSPFKNKMLQSAWTGSSYLKHYVANKTNKAVGGRGSQDPESVKGSKLFFTRTSYSKIYDRRILYYAIYSSTLIASHPEIDWANGVAIHEYFYKPGSYEVTDDLVNAIPGVQPSIVCYNARQVRGLGYERHSLPTYQKKISFGFLGSTCANTDFFATDLKVTGKFTASE